MWWERWIGGDGKSSMLAWGLLDATNQKENPACDGDGAQDAGEGFVGSEGDCGGEGGHVGIEREGSGWVDGFARCGPMRWVALCSPVHGLIC